MQALVKKHALTCAERSAVDRTVQDIKLGRVPRCGDCDRSRSVIRAFHAAAGQNFGLLGGGFLLGGGWMLQWRPLGCFLILELHSVDGLALLRQTCSRATCSRAFSAFHNRKKTFLLACLHPTSPRSIRTTTLPLHGHRSRRQEHSHPLDGARPPSNVVFYWVEAAQEPKSVKRKRCLTL